MFDVWRELENEIGFISGAGLRFNHRQTPTNSGAAMNAYTTTATAIESQTGGKFSRFFRAFMVELRRAIELTGASYKHGILPPL
jgi:hypothetical protein